MVRSQTQILLTRTLECTMIKTDSEPAKETLNVLHVDDDEDFLVIYKRMKSYFKKPGANWLCCTEAEGIEKAIRAQKEKKIPLPKEETISIIKDWDLGEETPLYKKMGLYGKE